MAFIKQKSWKFDKFKIPSVLQLIENDMKELDVCEDNISEEHFIFHEKLVSVSNHSKLKTFHHQILSREKDPQMNHT